ncbi:MAG: COG1470 family protein [Methermicoccaceae archaeon]
MKSYSWVLACLFIVGLGCLIPCAAHPEPSWVVIDTYPENTTLAVGDGVSFNVWVSNTHPSQSLDVSVEVDGLPEGVVADVSEPVSMPASSSAAYSITLRANDRVVLGSYPLHIRAACGSVSTDVEIVLHVVKRAVSLPEDVAEPKVEGIPPEGIKSSITIEDVGVPPEPTTTEPQPAQQTPAFKAVMLVIALGVLAALKRKTC